MGNNMSAREAFEQVDKDGSGQLDFDEIQAAVGQMGHSPDAAKIRKWIKDHDQDGDGQLDFEEFQGLMVELHGTTPEPKPEPEPKQPPPPENFLERAEHAAEDAAKASANALADAAHSAGHAAEDAANAAAATAAGVAHAATDGATDMANAAADTAADAACAAADAAMTFLWTLGRDSTQIIPRIARTHTRTLVHPLSLRPHHTQTLESRRARSQLRTLPSTHAP